MDLSGNEIGDLGLKHLSSLFEENNTITELVKLKSLLTFTMRFFIHLLIKTKNLSRNFFGTAGLKYLMSMFKFNHSLKDVDLSSKRVLKLIALKIYFSKL